LGLVVGDQPDALAAAHGKAGQPGDRRGLTRAQEAADQDEAQTFHGGVSSGLPHGGQGRSSRLCQSLNGYGTGRSGVYWWTVIQANSCLFGSAGSGSGRATPSASA